MKEKQVPKVKKKLKILLIDFVLILIALIPIIIALLNFAKLPAQMITHIEFSGLINRLLEKKIALSVMSIITLIFPLLFKVTRSSPNSNNSFILENLFELMRICMAILLSYLFLLTVLFNLGYYNGFRNWGIPLVGILFILFGNLLSRIRFNYFLGIRTPWTLSNEEIWRRTHHFSGPVFIGVGLLMLFAIIFSNPFWIILASFIILVLVPTAYSYLISRKINRLTHS